MQATHESDMPALDLASGPTVGRDWMGDLRFARKIALMDFVALPSHRIVDVLFLTPRYARGCATEAKKAHGSEYQHWVARMDHPKHSGLVRTSTPTYWSKRVSRRTTSR